MIYFVTKTYLSKKIAEWTEIITYRLTAQARANMDQLRSEMADLNPEISVYTSVTYAQLVQLCNQSKLMPGTWYRMIDYVTKVANDPEARSAEHPFDLLLLATSESTLSEEVRFLLTSRNSGSYFKDCMLQAWKGWYSLTNDTSRFHWASPTGTGVIYRLIDEWGYDYPYDFKNIQFKRYRVFDDDGLHADLDDLYIGYNSNMQGLSFDSSDYVWCYTLSLGDRTGTPEDASLLGFNGDNIGNGYGIKGYYGNSSLKPATCSVTIDDEVNSVFCLNNVVCFMNNDLYRAGNTHLDGECINMTLSTGNMTIGSDNMNIIMGARCYDITIGIGCCELTFSQECSNMSFSQGCRYMSFSQGCGSMSFFAGVYGSSQTQSIGVVTNANYTQFVAMKSDGNIRIFNPADVA